jgi:hypothetical protein
LFNSIYSTKDLQFSDRRGETPQRRKWINYIKGVTFYDSNKTQKGATSADVLRREVRRNHQRKNGLQWKSNKRMDI